MINGNVFKGKPVFNVLLISLVNWDSLIEVPAMLKLAGCTVDIYCQKNSWVLKNKYFDRWIPAPEDVSQFVREVVEFGTKYSDHYDWIIPCDDGIIRHLNECPLTETLFYKLMPLTKIENRELLGSKAGFSALCTKYSICTPRYLIYTEELTVVEIGDRMKYPFLMKVDKSEGGYGVFLCKNEMSVVETLEKIQNKNNLVFQQFINGYDVNVEALFKDNQLIVYSYSRTEKIMGKFGVSTQRLFYQSEEIKTDLMNLGSALGLNGFCNIVYMYSEAEKKHYLIEVDVRPNAWMFYGKFMGNSFTAGVNKIVNRQENLVIPDELFRNKRLTISLYKKDVHRCLQEKDYKGLWGWLTNRNHCWRYIPLYDTKLFLTCTGFLVRVFFKLVAGKLRKVCWKSELTAAI